MHDSMSPRNVALAPVARLPAWDPQLDELRDEVRRLRLFLQVQAELVGAEARATLDDLDARWQDIRARTHRFEGRTGARFSAMRDDVVSRLEDLRRRYWSLRDRMLATTP